ncbi:MAG: Asp-tRNA(Asn)/Glu-tRNA(Gln) amidotransferase subunit GatC [Patescibacteria group bacterium]
MPRAILAAVAAYNMITKEEVLRLAALARIDIPDSQVEKVRADFDTVLAYVKKINEAGGKDGKINADEISDLHIVRSVLRDDGDAHESGIYTEALLAAAPSREGNFVKVKKILAQ